MDVAGIQRLIGRLVIENHSLAEAVEDLSEQIRKLRGDSKEPITVEANATEKAEAGSGSKPG